MWGPFGLLRDLELRLGLPEPQHTTTLRVLRWAARMRQVAPLGRFYSRSFEVDAVGTAKELLDLRDERVVAVDLPELDVATRRGLAERVLTHAGLTKSFEPEALLTAAEDFRAFVQTRWADATWRRELPISALLATPQGDRRIQGSIDLLLQTERGVVLVDHKSFPGRSDAWSDKALGYAPQLMAYARALSAAGKSVLRCFIHFTIGGGVVEVGAA